MVDVDKFSCLNATVRPVAATPMVASNHRKIVEKLSDFLFNTAMKLNDPVSSAAHKPLFELSDSPFNVPPCLTTKLWGKTPKCTPSKLWNSE